MSRRLFLTFLTTTILGSAQVDPAAVRQWRASNEKRILDEYSELIRIPNVSADLPNVRKNAEFIRAMFEKRGVPARLLEVAGASPVVFGEIKTPGAKRTIIFYAHYDGQPVDPKEWLTPPFEPVMRTASVEDGGKVVDWRAAAKVEPEWRLFGRATSDDKAPIMAMAAALDAMKAAGARHRANIKFFFEGEEEAGSPNLEKFARQYRDLLQGDVWLICDGPVHQNRQQSLFFGVRGVTSIDLTVYGPRRELHSGHYGNWAPNPAMMLSRLLATMTDGEGRVLVAGYYDGLVPMNESEKRAMRAVPDFDAELMAELGLARSEGSGEKLIERITYPSLNVRGLASAGVGKDARNVVPAQATAAIDIRLVKGLDWRKQVDKVVAHIRQQGYFVTESDPTEAERRQYAKIVRIRRGGGYNAVRTSMDLPVSRAVIAEMRRLHPDLVLIPTHGGSVPLWVFEEVLATPLIGVPIVNHDNNQHSYNENLRIANLWKGIETMAVLLSME